MKNFNGYGTFDYIMDPNLRTYNRVNTYLNVKDRHGKDVGRNYLKQFKRNDILEIHSMMLDINRVGFEQYRRNFMRNAA